MFLFFNSSNCYLDFIHFFLATYDNSFADTIYFDDIDGSLLFVLLLRSVMVVADVANLFILLPPNDVYVVCMDACGVTA